jgi:hypothetical protein
MTVSPALSPLISLASAAKYQSRACVPALSTSLALPCTVAGAFLEFLKLRLFEHVGQEQGPASGLHGGNERGAAAGKQIEYVCRHPAPPGPHGVADVQNPVEQTWLDQLHEWTHPLPP